MGWAPKGIYEISNLTAEKIIRVYHEIHGIRAVLLSKIRRVMGWEPHTGLADGIRQTVAYYRQFKAQYW